MLPIDTVVYCLLPMFVQAIEYMQNAFDAVKYGLLKADKTTFSSISIDDSRNKAKYYFIIPENQFVISPAVNKKPIFHANIN